jgi:hypothetical protein
MVDLHHRFFVAIVGVVHHLHLIVLADWDEVHVVLVAELRRQRRRHEDGAREVARGLGAGRRGQAQAVVAVCANLDLGEA